MAIFSENEDLDKQGTHLAMDKVKGGRKLALAALGYKDTGEKNAWGRISMALPNPVGTVANHHIAKGLSGNTDTAKVLKATNAENKALAGAQLKTAVEGVKMFATGGAGGIAGGASGGIGSALTGGGGNAITSAISGGAGGGVESALGSMGGEGMTQTLSKFGAKPSEFLSSLSDEGKTADILGQLNKGVENNSLTQEEEVPEEGQTTGNKLLTGITDAENALGNLSPLISAGVQQFGAAKGYRTALENESKQYKNEKVRRGTTSNII